jgi:hypothetical protein
VAKVVVVVGGGLVHGTAVQTNAPASIPAGEDVNGVLELRKSCTFSIDALPSGLGALSHCLPFGNNFLFLVEPFEILLNSR